jgi:diguanylate cyclase (GGDEF)-like protein
MSAITHRSEAVEWQLTATLFDQTATMMTGAAVLASTAIVGFFATGQPWFLEWAAALALVVALRVGLEWFFAKATPGTSSVKLWRFAFAAGAVLMGLIWGCCAAVLQPGVPGRIQVLVVSVAMVLVMGASARNAGYPLAARAQILCALGPLFIVALRSGNAIDHCVCITIVALVMGAFANVQTFHERTISFLIATEQHAALVGEVVRANADLAAANERLETVAMTDGLTRIANRRRFDIALGDEIRRAQRDGTVVSLLMADVDFFKKFNDMYGHQAGDECLQAVAGAFATTLRRPGDLVARYGGEEFVAILPQTAAESAAGLADAARARIEFLRLTNAAGINGIVTVSIGVVCAIPSRFHEPEDFIKAADAALYVAKSRGRNCVRMAPTPQPSGTGRSMEGALS